MLGHLSTLVESETKFSLRKHSVGLFSGDQGVGNCEQQSLARPHLGGGAGSPAREPAQAQKVFGEGGASDQPEEL